MSLIFLPKSVRVFFILFSSDPKWTLSPSFEPDQPPSTLSLPISPIWSRHRRPPSPIKNPRRSLHLRSKTLASPSISYLTLNPRLTLHLRSPPSPSTSTTTTALRPISGFGFYFETHLALSILLALPKTPSNSVTNCESFFLLLFLKLVWLYGWFFFFFN